MGTQKTFSPNLSKKAVHSSHGSLFTNDTVNFAKKYK